MKITEFIISLIVLLGFSSTIHAQILAKINNKPITVENFKKTYKQASILAQGAYVKPEKVLKDLIQFELGVQEANSRNLASDPSVALHMNRELFKGYLEKSLGPKVLKIHVSDKERQQYYNKFPEIRSSHILIPFPFNATTAQKKEAYQRALKIHADVKKTKRPFNQLTKIYSEDTISKNSGGDVGYHAKTTIHPNYYNTLLKLSMNQVSAPIQTNFGFHIIKRTGLRPFKSANITFINQAIFELKRQRMVDKLFESLQQKYTVSQDKSLFEKIKNEL